MLTPAFPCLLFLIQSAGGAAAPAAAKPAPKPVALIAVSAAPTVMVPTALSKASQDCIDCHTTESPGIYAEWGRSQHFRAHVGCYECHGANKSDPDAQEHRGYIISVLVSPKDCGKCHVQEAQQFADSHHSKAGRILGSLDNVLAEVVEGNNGFKTPGFPEGVSAAAVNGCWQCHGTQVKVNAGGKMDPATWPNTGIGRLNPDGSEGSCSACHQRHAFSAAQARHPNTCGKCHLGPDHPQKEVYEESKHGIAFFSNPAKVNLDSPKWVAGEDYSTGPTCASCHMSATRNQGVTHDVGMRISWNNRPAVSVRPEIADAKMGLPGKDVTWEMRRESMKDVCLSCHAPEWTENFYTQYDGLIEMYNTKFATPGLALYALARKLEPPTEFTTRLDFDWYEIWHHEGRRARHGASMMAPDYTHWHGTYEVAKRFYSEFIPALEELVARNEHSSDAARVAAAAQLKAKLEEVLATPDHRWYRGNMDPAEKAKRAKAAEEFKKRYAK